MKFTKEKERDAKRMFFFTILWDDDVTWWWFLGISILSERFSFKKGNLIRKWRDSWTLFINNLVSWRNCKKELLKKHRILRKNSQKIEFNVKIAYFLLNFSIELNKVLKFPHLSTPICFIYTKIWWTKLC